MAAAYTVGQMEIIVAPAERGIAQSASAKMGVWAEAFEIWIVTKKSANTQRAYRKAWDDLLEFSGKQPWAIGKADMQKWAADMELRGLSDCTRAQRVAGISSFYSFVCDDYTVVTADGREVPLHNISPASGKMLRPKIKPYGKATHLGKESVGALLKAIKRNTIQGLRDYALFYGYIMTMRRNTEWRTLRWGDIEIGDNVVYYTWSGKGKTDQDYEMVPPVFAAVKAYLKAAKRWGKMRPEDYIFTALTDKATRLPGVAESFTPYSQPLSMREVGRLLKKYGRKAGLNTEKLKVHSLRHTGAHLRKDTGEDVTEISEHLAHESLAVTSIYLKKTEVHRDNHWAKVNAYLGF